MKIKWNFAFYLFVLGILISSSFILLAIGVVAWPDMQPWPLAGFALLCVGSVLLSWKLFTVGIRNERRTQHRLLTTFVDAKFDHLGATLNELHQSYVSRLHHLENRLDDTANDLKLQRARSIETDLLIKSIQQDLVAASSDRVTVTHMDQFAEVVRSQLAEANQQLANIHKDSVDSQATSLKRHKLTMEAHNRVVRKISTEIRESRSQISSLDGALNKTLETIRSNHTKNMDAHNRVVRSVVGHLRKDANLSQVLDRIIAMERRFVSILTMTQMDENGQISDRLDMLITNVKKSENDLVELVHRADKNMRNNLKGHEQQIIALLEDQTKSLSELLSYDERLKSIAKRFDSLSTNVQSTARVFVENQQSYRAEATTQLKSLETSIYNEIAKAGSANLNEYKNVIHKLTDRTERSVKRHAIDIVKQVEAILQLISRVDAKYALPSTGGWALTADSTLYLVEWIRNNQPAKILEIGSGASSVWMGLVAQEIGAKVVSLEHDENFLNVTGSMIKQFGLSDTVDLRYAPLENTFVDNRRFQWYARSSFSDIGVGFDLLVVDGPPESTGEMARYPAFPILAERLADSATVLLDDTHRPNESEIFESWLHSSSGFTESMVGLSRSRVMSR